MSFMNQQILELYTAMFNRVADHDGLAYWVNEVNQKGWSIEDVANSFSQQEEYLTAYPASGGYLSFVTTIYENLLGRAPDREGLEYWVAELNTGNISQTNAVLAIINGAKNNNSSLGKSDTRLIAQKTALSQYFAEVLERNDVENASRALNLVTSEQNSLNSALDRLCDDIGIDSISPKINLTFTNLVPHEERVEIELAIQSIFQMYSLATGISLSKDIVITYGEDGAIGWHGEFDKNNLGKLPSEDPLVYEFLSFEMAHIYYEHSMTSQSWNALTYPDNFNLRPEEMIGQGLMAVAYDKFGYLLDISDESKASMGALMDNDFQEAFENLMQNINLYSIYQYDVNDDIQVQTIQAAKHDLISLYQIDNNFFNNLLGENKLDYSSYTEFKELFIDAITTVSKEESTRIVNDLAYFRQIEEKEDRPEALIEIALFSSIDFPDLPINKQYMLEHPTSFRIFGQSNNIEDYAADMPAWQREPDVDFYNSFADVSIVNECGHMIWQDSVQISKNFANQMQSLTSLGLNNGEAYTINASLTFNGVLLQDSIEFDYLL